MPPIRSLQAIHDFVIRHDAVNDGEMSALLDLPGIDMSYRNLRLGMDILIESNAIIKTPEGYTASRNSSSGDDSLSKFLTQSFLSAITEDLEQCFPPEGIAELTDNNEVIYYMAYTGKKYRHVIPYLVELKLFEQIPSRRQLKILPGNQVHAKLVLQLREGRRKRTLETLLRDLDEKRKIGEIAERKAIIFEKNRLESLGLAKEPKLVSSDFVNAGYDIESFSSNVNRPNRFIEVKGITQANHFYLSVNEMEKAKELRGSYYLYLVDLTEGRGNPEVEIINNPYSELLSKENPDWFRIISEYEFKKKIR